MAGQQPTLEPSTTVWSTGCLLRRYNPALAPQCSRNATTRAWENSCSSTPVHEGVGLPDKVAHAQGIQDSEGVGPERDGAALLPGRGLPLQHDHWDAHLHGPHMPLRGESSSDARDDLHGNLRRLKDVMRRCCEDVRLCTHWSSRVKVRTPTALKDAGECAFRPAVLA